MQINLRFFKSAEKTVMAIDGVKIIDSDSAHDIYIAVVEAWKDGRPMADILAEVRAWEQDFCFDPWETEIYWSALAFSLWKVGHLPDDVRDKTLQVIAQGACEDWLKIDSKARIKRQKELDGLKSKIIAPNPKPLSRAKLPITQLKPLWSEGDVLSVSLPNGQFGACILVVLQQTPRKIDYHFAIVNLNQSTPPTLDEIGNASISFHASGGFLENCWINQKTAKAMLPYVDRVGQVELTLPQVTSYFPRLSVEAFFDCWNSDSLDKHCCVVWECIKQIIFTKI